MKRLIIPSGWKLFLTCIKSDNLMPVYELFSTVLCHIENKYGNVIIKDYLVQNEKCRTNLERTDAGKIKILCYLLNQFSGLQHTVPFGSKFQII